MTPLSLWERGGVRGNSTVAPYSSFFRRFYLCFLVSIQLVDIFARQVTVFGCICWKRRRQGRRLEPTWMYSRRFPEDMPGNSDEFAGTE